jgi:cobalt-zinc-cadmium efflux system membrane fusion protein
MNIFLKTLLLTLALGFANPLFAHGDDEHGHDEQDENRNHVAITSEMADKIQIKTAIATEGVLQKRIKLYGTIVADPLRLSHIQARYPGLIRKVNPSIDGTVVERHANAGEFTADRVLFSILDERVLELHLQAFPADASKIKNGQTVTINSDGQQTNTKIEYITPRYGDTPTLEVHAPVDNSAGNWVPNQAVEGWVNIAQTPVALLIDNRALQSFRDWQVVFIKIDSTYEIRPLELGRSDGQFTEVLSGLNPGDIYVVENSYLLKSDLEKSGASHDH